MPMVRFMHMPLVLAVSFGPNAKTRQSENRGKLQTGARYITIG